MTLTKEPTMRRFLTLAVLLIAIPVGICSETGMAEEEEVGLVPVPAQPVMNTAEKISMARLTMLPPRW